MARGGGEAGEGRKGRVGSERRKRSGEGFINRRDEVCGSSEREEIGKKKKRRFGRRRKKEGEKIGEARVGGGRYSLASKHNQRSPNFVPGVGSTRKRKRKKRSRLGEDERREDGRRAGWLAGWLAHCE